MNLTYSEIHDDYRCAMGDIEDLEDQVRLLESHREQLQGDIVDVCHSAKMILLAYMGYHEVNLEQYINHINQTAAEYAFKSDRRQDAQEWWDRTGVRKDITRMSMAQRMMWAYDQGLNA